MGKISAVWELFKVGNAVADPALWKGRQITATALGAVIIAAVQVLASFGVQLPIDKDSAVALAGGVIALVNVVFTLTTSDKIGVGGVPPRVPSNGASDARTPEAGGITDSGGGD